MSPPSNHLTYRVLRPHQAVHTQPTLRLERQKMEAQGAMHIYQKLKDKLLLKFYEG